VNINAIEIHGVSKRYRLGPHHGSGGTLREAISAGVGRAMRRGRGGATRDEIWSLRDVTLEVPQGQALGLIGRNGAGKSTLLKIITRITEPTAGVSRTRGRVGSLLEVGTGFHPELTGRENVFLNGAILGMGRRTTAGRFDEIVDFAGVEPFIDTPVKRYSSGMYLRLAFAVAAHLDCETMVVDEVLAVGDAEFQRKCLGKMGSLEREGRTVVFVSHNLDAIERLCGTVSWLDQGRLVAHGPAREVVAAYLTTGLADIAERVFPPNPSAPAALLDARVASGRGGTGAQFLREDPLTVEVRFVLRRPVPTIDLTMAVSTIRGVRVLDEAWSECAPAERGAPGEYRARVVIPPLLNVGEYSVAFWLGSAYEGFAYVEDALTFRLEGGTMGRPDRIVQLRLDWDVEHVGASASAGGPSP
jgi:ABC-2 type transport system ATP-binding protein/lipopolysaccharide transport system ATP-binding protein